MLHPTALAHALTRSLHLIECARKKLNGFLQKGEGKVEEMMLIQKCIDFLFDDLPLADGEIIACWPSVSWVVRAADALGHGNSAQHWLVSHPYEKTLGDAPDVCDRNACT